jgi:hypothetical protein
MKKTVTMLLGLLLVVSVANADTARLQVIHNAADPSAALVDVYVNGDKFIPDFAFRDATPFVDVPANVELNIGVAPAGGTAGDIIATFPVTFEHGKRYIAIANGVLDPTQFASNPDGAAIGFNIFAMDRAREAARWSRYVDLLVFHGATDAPTVDVLIDGWWVRHLANDLSYGQFTSYRTVRARTYTVNITPGNDNNTVVASFEANLSGLRGGAAVVFASGFLNPANNQNGPAFGLFAALPSGDVVELPSVTPMARLQVIHNAADPSAALVDIYVNGDKFIPNFGFREATPFVDVPAGVELNIGVAPAGGTAGDIIATFPVTLEADKSYVAIANGVLNPDNFADNPDGASIAFNIFARDGIKESSGFGWWVSLLAFHGATDAPTVAVVPAGLPFRWSLFGSLSYGEFSHYRYLPAWRYHLDVTPANDLNTVVATFEADLSGLGGGSAVVFASGFLSPDDNENGPAFGLFAALPNGQVVALPAVSSAAALAKQAENLPSRFELGQNYPNPFNPTTTIEFSLPASGNVKLDVFNVLGQTVTTLLNRPMDAGRHQVEFDASSLSSGVYFYRLTTEDVTETKKMVLMK